jgi:hypothetical protein
MPSGSTRSRALRLLVSVSAATALAFGAWPALAQVGVGCIQLVVDNPHPGDPLSTGKYEVGGRATDASASSGSGIDRVQVFVDNRDLGGFQVGEADLNPPSTAAANVLQSQLEPRFNVLVDFPSDALGQHTLFVYARSTSSGREISVGVPVNIGLTPLGTASITSGGTPPAIASSPECAPAQTVTNTTDVLSGSTTSTTPAQQETIRVTMDAPHPGATLTSGKYEVSGRATSSAGPIDRVQVFLDNRDRGGVFIGEAVLNPAAGAAANTVQSSISGDRFRVLVDFPSNQTGLHTVFVYARSAVTQKEGVASTGVLLNP